MRVLKLMPLAGIVRTLRDLLISELVAVGDLNGVAGEKDISRSHEQAACCSLACYLLQLRGLRRSTDG